MALTKVSTDGVKDDAITSGKIPANAVGASELATDSVGYSELAVNAVGNENISAGSISSGKMASDSVATAAIQDQAVTAAKLASGVQTTINNNADNRVITGSGTANTLNGESNVVIDSSGRVGIGATSFNDAAEYLLIKNDSTAANLSIVASNDAHSSLNLGDEDDFNIQKIKSDHTNNSLQLFTNNAERMRIDSSGNVGIGTTGYGGGGASPIFYLRSTSGRQMKIHSTASGTCGLQLSNSTTGEGEDAGFHLAVLSTGDGYINNPAAKNIRFATTGTERLRILASGGLTFNGDTAQANALDDYEEGTFTPTNTVGLTLTNNNPAYYVKIGVMVHIQLDISFTGANDVSQCGYIQSLPFTSTSTSNHFAQGSIQHISESGNFNFDETQNNLLMFIAPSESRIDLVNMPAGSVATRSSLVNRRFRISMWYKASS